MTIHSEGINPTDNEKLQAIQDAQKAVWTEVHGQDAKRTYSVAEVKRLIYSLDNAISTAVACMKAHAPTDDEREALRIAHLDARQTAYREDRALWFRDYDDAPEIATNAFFRGWDAAVAGGFRRSEVPEPNAEIICTEPGHAHCDRQYTDAEPQGEPSDAMVEAGAREAFFTDDAGGHIRGGHTWDTIPEVGRENYRTMVRAVLHAALRAAGGVR